MKGRIVVKIGSNVLSRDNGTLDQTRMSSLVDQVVALRNREYEVILVTSGAVACGRSLLKGDPRLDSVRQRQLYSAVGQVRLINIYHNLFREYGVPIGQVLTMKESFSTRKEYLNQLPRVGLDGQCPGTLPLQGGIFGKIRRIRPQGGFCGADQGVLRDDKRAGFKG